MRTTSFFLIILIITAFSFTTPAYASETTSNFSIFLENDGVVGEDGYYTNGIKMGWYSKNLSAYSTDSWKTKITKPLTDRIPFYKTPDTRNSLSLAFSQFIYTPEDIRIKELIEDDRPYAGIFFLEYGLININRDRMHVLEFYLGASGPITQAEDCQEAVHDIIGSNEPQGWHNQINDELLIGGTYGYARRLLRSENENSTGYDLIGFTRLTLGNGLSCASAGVEVRYGWSLPNDLGTYTIGPFNGSIAAADPEQQGSFYFFSSLDTMAVFHDITLDGNTVTDSHSVDKEHFRAQLMLGCAGLIGKWRFSVAYVCRTEEFKKQEDEQMFGTASVSYAF